MKIIVEGYVGEDEMKDTSRIMNGGGIMRALKACDYKNPPKVLVLIEVKGNDNN